MVSHFYFSVNPSCNSPCAPKLNRELVTQDFSARLPSERETAKRPQSKVRSSHVGAVVQPSLRLPSPKDYFSTKAHDSLADSVKLGGGLAK